MSKGKLLAVVIVWLLLVGVGAVAWKMLVQPKVEEADENRRTARLNVGSSDSRYDHRLQLSLDSFSGYAVLRSDEFAKELADRSIKITMVDDLADYSARLASLKSGESQFAVFTIDALLKTCSEIGDLPGSIVSIIDETRGADAILGYKDRFESVDDFNSPDVRFVLTPDSPSETLARVVMRHFDLPNIAENPIIRAKDARDVYEQFRKSSKQDAKVFVLWEPYVSKMMENPDVHTIVSTRDLIGFIVDVLVVNREYLEKNEDVVKKIVECYFRAAYQNRDKMKELVLADAKKQGEALTPSQAGRLVDGVQWKGTLRNYRHFGVTKGSGQHIYDMIENISDVLITTGAMKSDPTDGKPNLLYYDSILSDLNSDQFHPSGNPNQTGIDDSIQLRSLSDSEWNQLTTVGTLKDPQLVFARGGAKLLGSSKATLNDLANTLQTHRYYVKIQGVATKRGNKELNKALAKKRAEAAMDYLKGKGIGMERLRATEALLGDVPSVSFTLGQMPY